jgi:general secretion pathway protein D
MASPAGQNTKETGALLSLDARSRLARFALLRSTGMRPTSVCSFGFRAVAGCTLLSLAVSCTEPRQMAEAVPSQPLPSAAAPAARSPPPSSQAGPPANEPPSTVRPATPSVIQGSGSFVRQPSPPRAAPASVAPPVIANDQGDVSFNFVNADVREVVREILGDQLHLTYVVDPKLQATITAQTGAPLKRDALLPTLESILRANGAVLIQSGGGVYRVAASEDAPKASASTAVRLGPGGVGGTGYGIRVLPLQYIGAAELQKVLEPFVPPGTTMQPDAARNVLVVSGSPADLDGVAELVKTFDVDWLSGMSFALYPLKLETARNMADELNAAFGEGGDSPIAGMVRIVPIERINSMLVISSKPAYLRQVKNLIDKLDAGNDEATPRLFQYYVQNSRAVDLAAVLAELFYSGDVRAVQPETAPGTTLAQLGPSGQGGLGQGVGGLGQGQASPQGGLNAGATGGGGLLQSTAGAGGLGQQGYGTSPLGGSTGGTLLGGQQAGRRSALQGGGRTGQLGQDLLGQGARRGQGISPELELPPVRVVADEKNNALVVYAKPRDWRMIEGVIRKLDIVPLQVLIEATIAEVTLTNALQYGLQFFIKDGASRFSLTGSGVTSGNLTQSDINGVFPGFNYVLAAGGVRAILSALSSITDVHVVSSPQLLVLDHQTAAIQVGDQVPIVTQSAQSVINPDSPVVNSVQYRSTGVVLQVTPRVNSSGLVTLDVSQEVSDVARTTSSNINSPTIAARQILSSVIVQDGQTVALGGLIRDNQNNTRSGIPILSDLPVIGPLFRQTSNSTTRTELLVLLSPRIVRDPTQARELTDELRDRMRSVKPLEGRIR